MINFKARSMNHLSETIALAAIQSIWNSKGHKMNILGRWVIVFIKGISGKG